VTVDKKLLKPRSRCENHSEVWWKLPLFLLILFTYSDIHYHFHTVHSLYPFVEASLLFLHCVFAQREKPPWGADAEPGFKLGPAIQQASALPTEPRCTLI
jgi:hypothetical protein